jgi:lipopolysaccharide biosynthesis protein
MRKYTAAHIRPVENRGRDIAPFLDVLAEIMPLGYEAVCKIHTKKSNHLNGGRGWKQEDGENWRAQLFGQLLGSRKVVQEIIAVFRDDPAVGIIGPGRDVVKYESAVGANESLVRDIQSRLQVAQTNDFEFFAGSMFWFRPEALMPILALNLTIDAFPLETGQIDGTLAHALERLFNLSASKLKYKVCTTK